MKISRMTVPFAAALFAALTLSACSTPARVIQADKEGITRADRVDVQDFENASAQMLESLYGSGALERAPRKPAVVVFSRIVNDTGEYFDTDLVTVRVIEQLQNSGKVVLKTTFGSNARDQAGQDLSQMDDFKADRKTSTTTDVDYTLIGKILKNTARAGDVKQATYTFQLMLTDRRTGNTAWIAQRQITKQGTKASVGL